MESRANSLNLRQQQQNKNTWGAYMLTDKDLISVQFYGGRLSYNYFFPLKL